ncbi:MAG: alpha/beta hydrolase [Maricaulaceae bacterium]|nr:alpha/beta hydrolase [Maricaulaceae bacterium]
MSAASPWQEALTRFGLHDLIRYGRTVDSMRRTLLRAAPLTDRDPPDMAQARDIAVPGAEGPLNARLYVPHGAAEGGPLVLFTHGGGYVVGDLDTHDPLCRRLAHEGDFRVLALDYRLAPEHRFPAAVEDALAVFDWLRGGGAAELGGDPARLGVAGDSAGGGLAAVLAQARRGELRHQLLIYPLLQLVETNDRRRKALQGGLISTAALDAIRDLYLPDADAARDVRASPLFAEDLAGLPPAFIAASELDPLLDEGAAYEARLAASGVPVTRAVVKAMPHGFWNLAGLIPAARASIAAAARDAAKWLNG